MARTVTPKQRTRWEEIVAIWADNRWLFVLAGWLLGLVSFPLIGRFTTDFGGLVDNLVPETIGILFTVFILNRLAENRQQATEKEDLIREMGSFSSPIALRAVEALRARGWLQDGSLVSRNFKDAELERANLREAVLNRTYLVGANLKEVSGYHMQVKNVQMCDSDLRYGRFNVSDFSDSVMCSMDARYARFRSCNLQNAYLDGSDLEKCDFNGANLKGADLMDTNLEGANFDRATFDENTTLPDGSSWTPQTDMTHFTDPYHPEFWRPTDDSWLYSENDAAQPWWLRGQERAENYTW
jgi:hypothetical protein